MSSVAKAQSNYLVPLPKKGSVIALNNSGQVLYDTGLLTGNTFVAFPAGFTATTGSPRTLGASGVVAGTTTTGHLATYSAGTVTDLGLPPWQMTTGLAPTAINASGQIAGYTSPDGTNASFTYSGGVFNPININPGPPSNPDIATFPTPTDMNDSGQIVLTAPSQSGGCHGFLLTGAVLTDLGHSCPFAINASGQITGITGTNSGSNPGAAFIWANGKLTVLGASMGVAINKGGQIVGTGPPFFYNGVMTDINSLVSASDPVKSSVKIGSAVDINDSRLLLLLSTAPAVGSATAYLLQAPWLDVAPGPLTFANQAVGTVSLPQTLTLTNSGTVPLSLDSISFAAGAADFSQTNACPQSLAAGANCTVSVTFAPSVARAQNAIINVVTDGATITVPLAGLTPLSIGLSASTTTPIVGQAFTITWTTTPGFACQSSGGAPQDGWSVTTASGSVSVVEQLPGTYTYTLTCSADGVSAAQSLNVTVAPMTISLSATPTTPTVGQLFTITWTAPAASACQSSGGALNDGWSATTASGSVSVLEAAPGIYTYNLTCSAGGASTTQSLKVTIANPSPPSASGGGGALDLASLLLLVGLLACTAQNSPRAPASGLRQ